MTITPGGPAEKAGLIGGSRSTDITGLPSGGDLIVAVDGHEILTFSDLLSYLLLNKSPGDTVTLTILRDNKQMEVKLVLGIRP